MTQAKPGGLNGPFIQRQLPDWLKHSTYSALQHLRDTQIDAQYTSSGAADWFTRASTEQQQVLLDSQTLLRQRKRGLAGLLRGFKGITEFAEPLLKARLLADHGLDLDVSTVQLVRISREWTVNGRWQQVTAVSQSLLQAALQNFTSDGRFTDDDCLSIDGQYEVDKVIYEPAVIHFAKRIELAAKDFAALCHDLDLGRCYQEHIAQVFDTPLVSSRIRYASIDAYKALLQVQMHVALMKSEISTDAHTALSALIDGQAAPTLHGQALKIEQLSLYALPLADAWIITGGEQGGDGLHPVIVYLPGAPLYPLKEYPSLQAFKDDLRISLSQPAYQALLGRYVTRRDEADFSRLIGENIFHHVTGFAEPMYNPDANLHLRSRAVRDDLFKAVQDEHLQKLRDDAQVLAVPSAQVDEQASAARLAYWEGKGMTALNIAAFFIPVVGEVMAFVVAEQLVADSIEGAHAWSDGDRATAWAHFEGLAISMAIAAGLGGALKVKAVLGRPVVLDELVTIELANGERRLWRPDLKPYARPVSLAEHSPDAEGLYTLGDKRYVSIDQRTYEVTQEAGAQWRIEADAPEAYRPPITSNGQGAWQAYGEQPLRWDRRQLLRRLGHLTEGCSDAELAQAAQTSGISDDMLRKVHVDRLPAPPVLVDAVQRVKLDRRVTRLVDSVRTGTQSGSDLGYVPPLVLELPKWPGTAIEVFEGPELWGKSIVYGPNGFNDPSPIKITREEVYDNQLPDKIVSALDESAADDFFGDDVESAARVQVLRDKLGDRLQTRRATVRDSLAQSSRAPSSPAVQCLQREFAELTDEAAMQLVDSASSAQLDALQGDPGYVPIGLAERARAQLREVQISRAIDGLFEAGYVSLDSDRLALRLLPRLPGWTGTVRLEMREQTLEGIVLDAIGPQEGELKTLVRGDTYTAYDQAGLELGVSATLYDGVLNALPDSERVALGLQIHQGAELSRVLGAQAVADRDYVAQVMGQTTRQTWLKPIPRESVGYSLSGDPEVAGAVGGSHNPSLVGRVRRVYPAMQDSAAVAFLDALQMDEAQLAVEMDKRLAELEQLRNDLAAWVAKDQHEVVGTERIRVLPRAYRERVARAIEGAFQRTTEVRTSADGLVSGHELNLSRIRLTNLPSFTADMGHVTSLRLAEMSLRAMPEGFLRPFTGLRWLDLANNRLTRLPAGLDRLQSLTRLSFKRNRIVLDAAGVEVLAGLRGLKVLSLEDNPIELLPDVTQMLDLRGLLLRGTAIDRWPTGVLTLEYLEVLDLRANRITRMPADVLEPAAEQAVRVQRVNAATHLHGNALDADSRVRMDVYRQQTGVDFGVVGARGVHLPRVQSPSTRWLLDTPVAQIAEHQATWNGLVAQANSEDFFAVLNDLRGSSEFQRAYVHLKARVWKLLRAAASDSELRDELFDLAGHPETCADGILMVFGTFELRVLVHEAMQLSEQVGVERSLMDLAQGLFRLEAVDRIAQRVIKARIADNIAVDAVEVELAYRIELADALELPGQPRYMNYARTANVTTQDITAAKEEVLAAETPAVLKQSLAQRDFWLNFLKRQYPERFEAVNAPYFRRIEALQEDAPVMRDKNYLDQLEKIQSRRKVEEARLAETLTAQIWNDLPEQSTRL
jgi:hypothetical protein